MGIEIKCRPPAHQNAIRRTRREARRRGPNDILDRTVRIAIGDGKDFTDFRTTKDATGQTRQSVEFSGLTTRYHHGPAPV
jgi:hypothetical protein